jgi:hypothetical protein
VRVALIARDLLLSTRIEDAAQRGGASVIRISVPRELPEPRELDLVLVDWSERGATWGDELASWRSRFRATDQPRLILFGPHTDLEAHAAARSAGIGPMWARSRLVRELPRLFESPGQP